MCLMILAPLLPLKAQQREAEDPLMKPKIWSQLKDQPDNDVLWQKYFGKGLFTLNKKEYALYEQLKQHLKAEESERAQARAVILQQKAQPSPQPSSKHTPSLTGEDLAFQEWTKNITKNFGMIEVYFEDKFAEMGGEYIQYAEIHPNGRYSKTQWVDEHEQRLDELRKVKATNQPLNKPNRTY